MLQALLMIKLYHENLMAHVSTSRPQMRSCAGTETCAHSPVSGFHLGGTDRTNAVSSECWKTERMSRGSHKRHWAMWQTWVAQAARSLTQTVGVCGKAARLSGERRNRDSAAWPVKRPVRRVSWGSQEPADLHILRSTCLSCTHF